MGACHSLITLAGAISVARLPFVEIIRSAMLTLPAITTGDPELKRAALEFFETSVMLFALQTGELGTDIVDQLLDAISDYGENKNAVLERLLGQIVRWDLAKGIALCRLSQFGLIQSGDSL